MLEAIEICERLTGTSLCTTYVDESRRGDHIWWISDVSHFQSHYPGWKPLYHVPAILKEIYECNVERWEEECPATLSIA